jgi:hypothetical protein
MSLVARTSTVKCNFCGNTQVVDHEIDYECDAGYPYNLAREKTGWDEVRDREHGWQDRYPACRRDGKR